MAARQELLRCLLWMAAVVSNAAADAATEETQCSSTQRQEGCQSGLPALAKDQQLIQIGSGKLQVAQGALVDQHIPGQFGCEGMQDVKEVCSENHCKVLATGMFHKTCTQFCALNGRTCVWAAEEVDDSCTVLAHMGCDQTWRSTSDLLCECSSTSAPGSGGAPTAARDPATLQLVWSDEFDGSYVDTEKWTLHEGGGGFGNWEMQYYTSRPANVNVANGILSITAKCESYAWHGYTSAKLETKNKGDWGPGHRVDVRARVPTGKGTWPAIWMLSKDEAFGRWPRSGEIDIMESVGCTENKIYGTVHTEAYNHMLHTEKSNTVVTDVGAWHTYTIEWTETQISWYLDGALFHNFAPDAFEHSKWPYDREFYLILNVAVGGSWGGYCLDGRRPSCRDASEFGHPQVMEVDHVRVYAL